MKSVVQSDEKYCKRQNNGKLEKQNDVKPVNKKYHLKCISKSSYMSYKIFSNNLVVIKRSIISLKLNKTTYIGMCVLQLNKVLMFKFHYDYIKNKYDNKLKLLFTDTDERKCCCNNRS